MHISYTAPISRGWLLSFAFICASEVLPAKPLDQVRKDACQEVLEGLKKYQVPAPTGYFLKVWPGLKQGDPFLWKEYRQRFSNLPYIGIPDCATPELKRFTTEVLEPLIPRLTMELAVAGDARAIDNEFRKLEGNNKVDEIYFKFKALRESKTTPGWLAERYDQLEKTYLQRGARPKDDELNEMCSILRKRFDSLDGSIYFDWHSFDVITGTIGMKWFTEMGCFKPGDAQRRIDRLKEEEPERYYWWLYEKAMRGCDYPLIRECAENGEWRAMLFMAASANAGYGLFKKPNKKIAKAWIKKASDRIGCPLINNLDVLENP